MHWARLWLLRRGGTHISYYDVHYHIALCSSFPIDSCRWWWWLYGERIEQIGSLHCCCLCSSVWYWGVWLGCVFYSATHCCRKYCRLLIYYGTIMCVYYYYYYMSADFFTDIFSRSVDVGVPDAFGIPFSLSLSLPFPFVLSSVLRQCSLRALPEQHLASTLHGHSVLHAAYDKRTHLRALFCLYF